MFALLDELRLADSEASAAVWKRLTVLLEVHAEAEERYFYPRLLSVGHGAAGESVESETEDAVKDHNDIRDAIAKADDQPVGTDAWWQAVTEARTANSDHMAEEEREDLADFRRHASLETRHRIAMEFITFESQHADGIDAEDKDPQAYIEDHS